MCKECDKKQAMMRMLLPQKKMGGSISQLGYKDTSPYNKASSLMIHSPNGSITMNGVSKDLIGTDEYGNTQVMKANSGNYQFQGSKIKEVPVMQEGGGMSANQMGALQGGMGVIGEGANYFANRKTMTKQQKGKSLGSMIGAGLGLAAMAVGVPPQVGMAVGSQLGGAVGGAIGGGQDNKANTQLEQEQMLQSYNTVGIPRANNGLKLNNNMNFRDSLNTYKAGGQMNKSYQEGGLVSGEGAMPHSEGGVPTVDQSGQQIAEVEGGERIDSVPDTQAQDEMIMQIDQAQSPEEQAQLFTQLGQYVYEMTKKQEQVNPSEGTPEAPMEGGMPPEMGGQPMMAKGGKLNYQQALNSFFSDSEVDNFYN